MRSCFRPTLKRITRDWSIRTIQPHISQPILPFHPEKMELQPKQSVWTRNTTHLHWLPWRESWLCPPPTFCPSFECVVGRSIVVPLLSTLAAAAHAPTAWIYQVNNDDIHAWHNPLTSLPKKKPSSRNIISITACGNTVKHSAVFGLHVCPEASSHLQAHVFGLPWRRVMAEAFAGRFPVSTATISINLIVQKDQ